MYKFKLKDAKKMRLVKYYSYSDDVEEMFAPIIQKTLRFRSPSTFNDPFDCELTAKCNGEICFMRQDYFINQCNNIYVSSLTDSPTRLAMWSHYASNHNGFVVEYDVEKVLQDIEIYCTSPQCEIGKVEYKDEIVRRNLFTDNETDLVHAIFRKSTEWKNENEIRIVHYGSPGKSYEDIPLSDDAIKFVYIGEGFFRRRVEFDKGNKPLPAFLKQWKDSNKLGYMEKDVNKYELNVKTTFFDKWFQDN